MLHDTHMVKNTVVANVVKLFSGNSLALVIPFFLAPILTRLYTPEQFGSFELFAKILGVLALFSTLRYDLAIVLPSKENEALDLVRLAYRITFWCAGLVSLFCGVYFLGTTQVEGLPYETIVCFLIQVVILTGMFSILSQYLVRHEKFGWLAKQKLASLLVNQSVKIGGGFFFPTAHMLVAGHLAGLLAPLLMSIQYVKRFFSTENRAFQQVKILAKKYADFPKNNLPHALTDESEKLVMLSLVAWMFGEHELGLFAFSLRYLRIPVQLLGNSIGQVLFPRFTQHIRNGTSVFLPSLRTVCVLTLLGLIPFGSLFFLGETLFAFVLGEQWVAAGTYAEILTPWLFVNFVVSPLSFLPSVFRKQKPFFLLSAIGTGIFLLCIFSLGISGHRFITLLWVISGTQSILMLVKLGYILQQTKKAIHP